MLVILENQQAINVLGNQNAPNLTALGQAYPVATRYFARTHPSLPNYLELWAGTTFGVTDDGLPAEHRLSGATLGSQLDAAGIPWAGYFQSLAAGADPTVNGVGTDSSGDGLYQVHHNPIVYVAGWNPSSVKSFTSLAGDLDGPQPPRFCLVVPDMADDMHDPVGSTAADSVAVRAGDIWVHSLVETVSATAWWRAGGTILIVWDEAYDGSGRMVPGGIGTPPTDGGPVLLLLVSATLHGAKSGRYGLGADGNWDLPLTHAGLLGSIEAYFGLDRLNDAANPTYGDLSSVLIASAEAAAVAAASRPPDGSTEGS